MVFGFDSGGRTEIAHLMWAMRVLAPAFLCLLGARCSLADAWGNVTQVHIAYGLDPARQMSVAWLSNLSMSMTVRYGLSADALDHTSPPSNVTSYTIDNNYWGPYFVENGTFANYTSDWIHVTNLTGLEPTTTYFYTVGTREDVFNFTTGLLPGEKHADGRPTVLSIVGDIGQTADSQLTMAHMRSEIHSAEATIIAGDLAYADCDQPRWDTYGHKIESLAANMPLMVGPGNHEIEWFANDRPTFLAFESRYFMPAVAPAQGLSGGIAWRDGDDDTTDDDVPHNETWCTPSEFRGQYEYGNAFYSFTIGQVHFVSLNCYGPTSRNSTQYAWLESDLDALDRDVVPWVVVSVHCPWYSSNAHHYMEWQTVNMRQNMEDLFLEQRVNLVVAGHVHAYQRSHPVYKGDVNYPGAPVYIVVGDGGNREGHAYGYVHNVTPAWSAYKNDTQFGHGTLSIHNESHMLWEWHINEDPNWCTRDAVWITQGSAYDAPITNECGVSNSHSSDDDDGTPDWLWPVVGASAGLVVIVVVAAACMMQRKQRPQTAQPLKMPPGLDEVAATQAPVGTDVGDRNMV